MTTFTARYERLPCLAASLAGRKGRRVAARPGARWAQARWDRTASAFLRLAKQAPWRAAGIFFVVVVASAQMRRYMN